MLFKLRVHLCYLERCTIKMFLCLLDLPILATFAMQQAFCNVCLTTRLSDASTGSASINILQTAFIVSQEMVLKLVEQHTALYFYILIRAIFFLGSACSAMALHPLYRQYRYSKEGGVLDTSPLQQALRSKDLHAGYLSVSKNLTASTPCRNSSKSGMWAAA